MTGEPQFPAGLRDEEAADLIVNDCRASLFGLLLTEFTGTWISHPEATRTAQNKLVQLRAAQQVGLRVPRTLVSQDPEVVRHFCERGAKQVIVKTVAGSQETPVMTGFVTPELLVDADISLSPAIYQEYVPGSDHLRVCCFGDEVCSALLRTDALDWRYPLRAEVRPYRLDDRTAERLVAVITALGLRMGIVDMKLAPDGEPVWLELNPQGQFMFLEGMSRNLTLTRSFTRFLIEECRPTA
jgi:glutathione synthase/RimK-type ligase-like ATP-grasp enzyme